jgi:hypothetical protein
MKAAGQTHGWLLLLFLGLTAPLLHGRGARGGDLDRADALIAGRRYDEAMLILAGYAGKNPGEFSRTRGRLRKIMLLRNSYHTLAGELLDLLAADPDNSEKILDLTRRLEAIEPSQGTTRRFIIHVEELALFGRNRRLLERTMAEGQALLDRGDHMAALRRYAGGLEIAGDTFFSAGPGEPADSRFRSSLDTLTQGVEDFAALEAPLRGALAGVERIGSGDDENTLAPLRDCYARLSLPVERLIAANNAMTEAANELDEQLAGFLREDPGMGDQNYLSFVSRIIRGRGDPEEGLLGAAAGLWTSALSPFDAALERGADLAYRNAAAAQESGDFARSREQLELALAHCALGMRYIDDWGRFYRGQDVPVREYFGRDIPVCKAEDYLRCYSLELACAGRAESLPLLEEGQRLASADSAALELWRQGSLDTEAALDREARSRAACHDLAIRTDAVFKRLSASAAAVSDFRQELSGERALFVPLEDVLALFSGMDAAVFVRENAAALREYTIANGDFQRRVAEWKDLFARGSRLLAGNPGDAPLAGLAGLAQNSPPGSDSPSPDSLGPDSPGSDSADPFIARYPREVLELFERIGRDSGRDVAEGRALVVRYEKEPPRFFREPRIAALYNSARSMTRELGELGAAAQALEQGARTQAAQAEAFEREGGRLHREAQAALARNDFALARDRAIRAGERYDASLGIQESAALRRVRDDALVGLGEDIARLEHEALVREVRSLVNAAMGVYFEGRFEAAEEYLVRAVSRRRDSGVEEDPEVSYWLTVVRGAMNIRAGAVIFPTAPLYAEMSQLLSEARKDYHEGTALIAADLREEGFSRFAEARRKTAEVRILFPVNQEASLLDLRMDQVTDPAAFNASFQRRLNEAVSGAARGSVESFAELQNLSRINPGHPGIRGLVDQAEIALGYRPPPPDPRSLARSGELVAAARGILDRNLRSQFPVALEMMNQALALNPSNSQAMSLKDRLQTELGGGGSAVLSSAAEREYRRAALALQRGNTLVAMTIVRQLLSDPRNQQSRRIQDLQKRIESIL